MKTLLDKWPERYRFRHWKFEEEMEIWDFWRLRLIKDPQCFRLCWANSLDPVTYRRIL